MNLNCPVSIALDNDGYLFLTDRGNSRLIGSGPHGYRCIVGCSGAGAGSNQLNQPSTFSFDSEGNIYLIDRNNVRLQKFLLTENSCSK